MLTLNNLKSPKGAHRDTKRLGRGPASGQGQQAGKGHKGQKARSGGGAAIGFEGGQMPLYRRLAKRGFKNAPFKTIYAVVNLSLLSLKFDKEEINRESLVAKGILKGINKRRPVKVLANGKADFNKSLNFKGIDKFSKTAQELITKNGGSIELPTPKAPVVKGQKRAKRIKGKKEV